MIERWSRDQVLELAPDASSKKAAQGVASPAKWSGAGAAPGVVWGECKGSGATPYRACVDLSEPAYRCNCPSRKFPCKHALGLLLLWSADGVPGGGEPPAWAAEWLEQRRGRAAAAEAAQAEKQAGPESPGAPAAGESADDTARKKADAERRAAQREQRVAAGLSELERWLADQVRQGIAATRQSGFGHWDDLAKRLVDAQAPGVAGVVSRLAPILADDDWPGRLLEEYSLLHLLAAAHRRELPAGLTRTVRSRVGFPVSREEVLAGETVRDEWHVLGRRDLEQDRLVSRRVWLRGHGTGRAALVLSFAPPGQALDASLVTGGTLDAELAFYPGSSPRAQVAVRHEPRPGAVPPGTSVEGALGEVARAMADDPWLESWPVVLSGVLPLRAGEGWLLGDPGASAGWPLASSAGVPWRLVAASGGHPVTVAAEWTPRGLLPLTTWDAHGRVIVL